MPVIDQLARRDLMAEQTLHIRSIDLSPCLTLQ
jgi:hypothetical protein